MGWIGKIVGGTIGFALGGPLGGILGAALGHGFDQSDMVYIEEKMGKEGGWSGQDRSELIFFAGCFSMLAKLAKADGRVSETEISAIEQFMDRDLGLNAESRKIAINIFRSALKSPEPFERFALQFREAFYRNTRILSLMIDILCRVAFSDGAASPKEIQMIRLAGSLFGFHASDVNRMMAVYEKKGAVSPYSVLGVPETATNAEIKSRYRELVREYHPDKVSAKGLPDDFVAYAQKKFVEVQNAYEAIQKERGM